MMYLVCQTRHYYAPAPDRRAYLVGIEGVTSWSACPANAARYSRKHAVQIVAALDDAPYELGHGESSRPDYRVVRAY